MLNGQDPFSNCLAALDPVASLEGLLEQADNASMLAIMVLSLNTCFIRGLYIDARGGEYANKSVSMPNIGVRVKDWWYRLA